MQGMYGAYNNDNGKSLEEVELQRKKITVRGLSGLKNIGNTCFMNAVLQALNSTPYLTAYLLKRTFKPYLINNNKKILANEKRKENNLDENCVVHIDQNDLKKKYKETVTYRLYELFKHMWKRNNNVTPDSFKKIIGKICPIFDGYSQNDSQEVLNLVLDQIHEDTKMIVDVYYDKIPDEMKKYILHKNECNKYIHDTNFDEGKRRYVLNQLKQYEIDHEREEIIYKSYVFWEKYISKNYSIITELFTGLFYSNVKCHKCNTQTFTFENFTNLSLQIPDEYATNVELVDCLKTFTDQETLTNTEKYYCEICKERVDASKKIYIWEAPEILIIHFKRFKTYPSSSIANSNLISKIQTQIMFPLNDLDIKDCLCEIHKKSSIYDLYAVVEHSGSYYSGHYFSYCKSPINNKWYCFNDSHLEHIPDDEVEKKIISRGSYLLFYQKKHS